MNLCAVDTEMQLLYVLWCDDQLSVQPLFKKVPLSMCFWKWLLSGMLSRIFLCIYLPQSALSADGNVGAFKRVTDF